MKKLLAILLSVLVLCTMIPFAAVSAEGEPAVELVCSEEPVNAGDTFEVEVYLRNIPEAGLIGVQVEIEFDHDAFELVTYFDEDEEMYVPQIEVGSKYNASSNKYILFAPIDEETGKTEHCLVQYMRATATANQVRTEELFYTATFKVKDDAYSGTYNLTTAEGAGANWAVYGGSKAVPVPGVTSITVNGLEPPACDHEYDNACDVDCNLCSEVREVGDHVYAGDCDMNCDECDAVRDGETGDHTYDNGCDTDCNVCGAVREPEHTYLYQCDKYCNECGEKTNPSANHSVLHVDAKPAANCVEFGNVEYWYCEYCGVAWTDANMRYQTNLKRVLTAGACVSDSPACKDGKCVNCGLPCAAETEHTFSNACDKSCNVCGTTRTINHKYSNACDKSCNVCGATRSVGAHKYSTVLKKATTTANGYYYKKCSVCGATTSKTTVYKASSVKLSKTSYTYNGKVQKPSVTVKGSNGKTISTSNYTVSYSSGCKSAGTYKVTIKFKGNYSGTKTLTYKINPISVTKCKISLSKTSYTYNGKAQKPTVTVKNASGTKLTTSSYTVTYASGRKNVGKYKVTIKMKGNYSGTKTLYFKVNPAKTTVKSLTAAKKALTVKWTKKTTQVTGYQIQYSTSKSFKSYKTKTVSSYKTTSAKLTGLKAKTTYYVRVRTYKTVKGVKYYSGWTTIKYKKTK